MFPPSMSVLANETTHFASVNYPAISMSDVQYRSKAL